MARPKLNIKGIDVEKLVSIGCQCKEIADFYGCAVSTISRGFAKDVLKGKSNCKMQLRKAQMKSALGGNVTMQIWLGKQMLGQKDKTEISGTQTHKHIDLSHLNDTELKKERARIKKITS